MSHYFDNDVIQKAIIQYQKGLKKGREDIHLLYPYTDQIQSLIRGVINTHKIYRWWPDVDELIQEGVLAIFSSFKRFDPKKGTAFNYLSIVAKQHLKNWTQGKNKKSWVTVELNEEIYVSEEMHESETSVLLEQLFLEVEVEPELQETLEGIMRLVSFRQVHNHRDIVKQMVKEGFDKENVTKVFLTLSKHFGGDLNLDNND